MGYGSCQVHNLPCLPKFETARDFFNRTTPLRGNGMAPNERPMHPDRGGAYKKFRVAEVTVYGRKAYDLVFYDTPVIRYFEPNEDGTRHVTIRYYNSVSTCAFMDRHGWGSGAQRFMVEGADELASVPYSHSIMDVPSAFLTFNINNRLLPERSWHIPFCKYLSSDEDKQRRKDFKRILETVFDVLYVQDYQIREMASTVGDYYSYGRRDPKADSQKDVHNYIEALRADPNADVMLNPNTINDMLTLCADSLRKVCHDKAYQEASEKFGKHSWSVNITEFRQGRQEELIPIMDLKPAVIMVRDKFLANCGFMQQSKKVELPLFHMGRIKGSFYRDTKADVYTEEYLFNKYKKV